MAHSSSPLACSLHIIPRIQLLSTQACNHMNTKKGIRLLLLLTIHCHTTESAVFLNMYGKILNPKQGGQKFRNLMYRPVRNQQISWIHAKGDGPFLQTLSRHTDYDKLLISYWPYNVACKEAISYKAGSFEKHNLKFPTCLMSLLSNLTYSLDSLSSKPQTSLEEEARGRNFEEIKKK